MRKGLLFMMCVYGCADSKESVETMEATADNAALADTGRWSGSEDAGPSVEPYRWSMSGALFVANGTIEIGLSSLRADVEDEQGQVMCQQTVPISSVQPVETAPDPDIEAWWEVTVGDASGGGCTDQGVTSPFPVSFGMGLGPLHGEIEAILGSESGRRPSAGETVKSVFVALNDPSTIWVFGLATSDGVSPREPIGERLDGDPVSDGYWKFVGLYPFAY